MSIRSPPLTSLPGIFSLSHIRPSFFPQAHQLSPPVTFLLPCLHGWFLCLYRSWLLREASASPPNVSFFASTFPSLLWNISLSFVCPSVPWKMRTLPRISLIIRISRSPKICPRDAQNGVSHGDDRTWKSKETMGRRVVYSTPSPLQVFY